MTFRLVVMNGPDKGFATQVHLAGVPNHEDAIRVNDKYFYVMRIIWREALEGELLPELLVQP